MCLKMSGKSAIIILLYILFPNISAEIHREDMHLERSFLKNGKGIENEYLAQCPYHRTGSQAMFSNIPGFDFDDFEMAGLRLWYQGIIPFYIDDFSYDKVLRDKIRSYLETVNTLSGLRFLELPSPPEDDAIRWVFFINRRGILNIEDHDAKDFTTKGVQKVTLGYDSMIRYGEMARAVLAIVGVPPQHNAPNRDNYVTVFPENIVPCKRKLFHAISNVEWLFHDIPYDFSSASHYHPHVHTANGYATIVPKENLTILIGEVSELSNTDILKIRMLYNYITKKSSNKDRAPDCVKLFRRGPNWNNTPKKNYTSVMNYSEIKKRNKPLNYLKHLENIRAEKQKLHNIFIINGVIYKG